MKKSLQLLSLTFIFAVLISIARLSGVLPVDTQPYVEKKYAGWNGVLQAWVCMGWNPGGSFIRWLNSCAADFEKSHEGVYIEFTPVSVETMRGVRESGMRLPELLFFSPGIVTDASLLKPSDASDVLRSDFAGYGDGYAHPIALGGYIWAYNATLCDAPPSFPRQSLQLSIPLDDGGHSFSAALTGLLSADPGGEDEKIELPDAGIDLGLPASAGSGLLQAGDALDLFIDGKLAYLPVTQMEIARLIQLRDNGRGPDWRLAATGKFAFTDQLLMAGIVEQDDSDGTQREELSTAFLSSLYDPEAQAALADEGAFTVTSEPIHSDFSAYAPLDTLLNSRRLCVPDCFSEYSVPSVAAIVRTFLDGKISAADALFQMGFAGM